MDTVESRRQIGFPKERADWAKAEAIFDEHTLKIAGHPVMEDWERDYMDILAEIATSRGGHVLEVGYGLGLSARAIQAKNIVQHFVIECHPDVLSRCITEMRHPIENNRIHILSGFWEDITVVLANETFDGILFDTYPLREEEIHANHFWFFKEAYRLLKPGGVLTYYSDEAKSFSGVHMRKLLEAGFESQNIGGEICEVSPPVDCEYWHERTMLAPKVYKSS